MHPKETNNFIQALNEYFHYDAESMDDFKEQFLNEYAEKQSSILMSFLCWYEEKIK